MRIAALIYRDTDPDTYDYYAVVPALPNVFTWGNTYDEVVAHLEEAIKLHLQECDEIPVDVQGEPPHLVLIDVDVPTPRGRKRLTAVESKLIDEPGEAPAER